MFKVFKTFLNIGALLLLLGPSSIFAKPSVKALTSKSSAKKVVEQLPTASFGGGLKKHSFGVGIGQIFLKGGFENRGANKMTLDLYYNYSVSHTFDLLSNLHFNELSSKGQKVTLRGITTAVKFKLYQIDEFAPFVIGGLGIYSPHELRLVNGSYVKSNREPVMGWNAGFGADLRLNNKVMVGMLVHYHDPFDIAQDIGEKVMGAYTKLLVTMLYSFK